MFPNNFSDRINQRINEWKQRLIDLTRRNKLLYFQPGKGPALTIEQPSAETIFDQIYKKEKSWRFWLPPIPKKEKDENQEEEQILQAEFLEDEEFIEELLEERLPKPDELVCKSLTRKELEAKLKNF